MSKQLFKTKLFFSMGRKALPLIIFILIVLALKTPYTYSYSGKDRAYELWSFYNKYIVDMDFVFPLKYYSSVDVTGSAIDGLRFTATATWQDLGSNWYKVVPDSALFYIANYPVIVFRLRVLEENINPLDPSGPQPDLTYPVLSMTHHHGDDVLLLVVKINPDQTSNDIVTFSWLRARINATEFFFETMDVVEGSGTTIVLPQGFLYNNYLKIGIIPAIWSEKHVDPLNNTYYYGIFGFYTVIDNGTYSEGFGIAWKTLKFYPRNFTEFKKWMMEFREWWIDLGISHFARTDEIAVEDYYYVSNFAYNTSSALIEFKNVAVYDIDIDYNNLYHDLQKGILPEYQYRSLIAFSGKTFLISPRLMDMVIYIAAVSAPLFIIRRDLFIAAFIAVIIVTAVFNWLFKDFTFLVLGGLSVVGMWITWGGRGT